MFLTGTIITGIIVITSSKVLYENKKKETSWIVFSSGKQKSLKRWPSPALGSNTTFQTKENVPQLSLNSKLSDIRTQQLKEISHHRNDDGILSEVEKKANHELNITWMGLALATGGALFYTPLNLLALPMILLSLRQYVIRAYQAIFKEKKVGVAVIDLIGTATPLLTGHLFLAAVAVHLSNLSRKLLIKTEDHSQNSLTDIFGQKPNFVWVVQEDADSSLKKEVEIPFDALQIGDLVVVVAGQIIPIDGTISQGYARIDQRTLTGESQPVEKEVGEPVFASTVVIEGRIHIQVEKAGQETVAAQIGQILNSTADFKSQVQSRGKKIVDQGATPTVMLSLLTLPLLGAESALTMLYAAFGYHMRHSAPISVLNYLRIASELGVLIKDGRSLELLSEVDTVVFDKTGTLTSEIPTVGQLHLYNGYSENELLTWAAAAEEKQTHPIAQAILQEAKVRELILPKVVNAKYEVGYGLKVSVSHPSHSASEQLVRVGSRRFIEMEEITIGPNYKMLEKAAHEKGHTLIYVAIDNQFGGAIELMPTIRPEAKQIVHQLRQRNISLVIISGDHEEPTRQLAHSLGIEQYFAETLPQNKATIVEQLQEAGKSVCFVGDGINDSIALKTANVSISLCGASTAATDSASIILMDSSLNRLLPLLDMASSLDANLKRGTVLTILPGIICVGGVFFFHFGVLSGMILYYGGLVVSISNALLPLIGHKKSGQP